MKKDAKFTKNILYNCKQLKDYENIDMISINNELGDKEKFLRNKNSFLGSNSSVACHAKYKKLTRKIQKNLLFVKNKPLDVKIKRL